jgi:hypothetical protein
MVAVEGDLGWWPCGSFNFYRLCKKRAVLSFRFLYLVVCGLCSVLIVKLAECHVVMARQMNGAPTGHACLVIVDVPDEMVRVAADEAAIVLRLSSVEGDRVR